MTVVTHRSLVQVSSRVYGGMIVVGFFGLLLSYWMLGHKHTGNELLWVSMGSLALLSISSKEFLPWISGALGENRMSKALSGLPDEYILVRNWVVPGTKQGDVDMILLGPHGVLVVEVKNFQAKYECDGDTWVNVKENGYRKRMKSPSRQLRKNVKSVAEYLHSKGCPAPVYGVLALAPGSDVKVQNPSVEIVECKQLVEYVCSLHPQRLQANVALFR